MYPIFISYRRSDLSLEAEWLYNLISTFFGEDIVFFDKQEIEAGQRWDDTLHAHIQTANIVLILIGPQWLKEQLESGMRRLDDPEDWVRKEVFVAIEGYKKNPGQRWVFSVLVNGAGLPKKEWLPSELSELASFQIERKLVFNISNYLEVAGDVYDFIKGLLSKVGQLDVLKMFPVKPFDQLKVPNPYDIPGFQLPPKLKRPEFPFKGLEYFHEEDARIFFGRKKEIGEVLDYFKKSQTILRLYGQSGVGKSSFLFAGLFPRLKARGYEIGYFRRGMEEPLDKSLAAFIKKQENFSSANVLVILDQVEEIITNPNPEDENELENLVKELYNLREMNIIRSKPIRVILSYRKEYDVEIRAALRKKMKDKDEIDSNEYLLNNLAKEGMKDAITGITKDQDLMDAYHLQIENNLENIIINEFEGKENTTPLLQILLRKMWDKVCMNDKENRKLTKDVYEECKSKDLQQLLIDQLQLIAKKTALKEAVESGLAMDVLNCFVTEADTSIAHIEDIVCRRYDDEKKKIISQLLQVLVDAYLLIPLEIKEYRIPHDSLAKATRIHYDKSELPGQRALRLLESKKHDIEVGKEVEFSKPDLAIIDAGRYGMRKLTEAEEIAIEHSRTRIKQYELELEEKNKQLEAALEEAQKQTLIAKEQTLQARAKALAATARQMMQTDTTIALRLAEAACKTTHECTMEAQAALIDATKTNIAFYKSILLSSSAICAVAFSPDGKWILTGSSDKTARLWSLDATLIQVFESHKATIHSVAFSPDGNCILTGSDDKTARLWSLDGKVKQVFEGHQNYISSVAFSPDGKCILTGSWDQTAGLWSLDGKLKQVFLGHQAEVISVAFSPNGKYILTGSWDKTARLWSLKGILKQSFVGHKNPVNTVGFSPDGKSIITGSSDSTARLWSLDGKANQVFAGHTDSVQSVAFSPDGKYILTGSVDSTARLWSLDGKLKQVFEGHQDQVKSVACSPDGKYMLTGSWDQTVRLWSLGGKANQVLEGHTDRVESIAFSPDGNCILTGSVDETARLWSLDGKVKQVFKGHQNQVQSVTFSPDGKCILIGSGVKAWLLSLDGTLKLVLKGHQGHVSSVAFSPDGKCILTGSWDQIARLFSFDGTLTQSFKGHQEGVKSVAFSPDGKCVLTGSNDKTARLWSLDGTMKQSFEGHQEIVCSVAFSPDGKYILSGSWDKTARLWSLDGSLKQVFEVHQGYVYSVAFSSDGKYILTGSMDRVLLWSLDGRLKQVFEGLKGIVSAVVFSRDGKCVLTGSYDKTVRLWSPFWEIINPENTYVPTPEQMIEYDIPEDMEWGKVW